RARQSDETLTALNTAAANIEKFHRSQLRTIRKVETLPGVVCWQENRPIETVGFYVPAGSAPLPSTVLMLGIPAMLAGCSRIVLCSPPQKNGKVDALVLAAATLVGIKEIYNVGGAQAIAAMAYGTESIPKVNKIFGPGNRYVAAAKQFVATDPEGAAIDLLAGPSELLVIADEYANATVVAADLLSQAEHDPDAQVALVTPSAFLAQRVQEALAGLQKDLPRRNIIEQSLKNSFVVLTASLDEAIRFANDYAPEHLLLNVREPESLIPQIRSAGSVFLGPYSPVTAGDYASGTNHTLPTGGSAKWTGGISVESFQKTVTFQSISREGLQLLAPTLTLLAAAEGLEAHKRAVAARTAIGIYENHV
ncbi:MAG TPA: histidinol dehydrogenase, partial [Bacteroidota bacterium]|nr:histidinol dehydrogenase [Bacteroidota bacterium]